MWLNDGPRRGFVSGGDGVHRNLLAPLVLPFERHPPVHHREEGVVVGAANVLAGVELRAALAHDDVPGDHLLAAVLLHAEVLRVAGAAVLRGADALLVSHGITRPGRR